MLYNMPFKNNEYLFEDIPGITVSEVMNYSRPYLAREAQTGQKISKGEKYLLKTHTEEIPTISGECTFDSVIPFRIKMQDNTNLRVNKDIVDSHTKIIQGLSYNEKGQNFTNDSGFSNVTWGESFSFDPKQMKKQGHSTFTVINAKEKLMTTRTIVSEEDSQPQYKFYKWSPKQTAS